MYHENMSSRSRESTFRRIEVDAANSMMRHYQPFLRRGLLPRPHEHPWLSQRRFPSESRRCLALSLSTSPQSLIEKIVQRHITGSSDVGHVRSGEIVAIRPAHVMTHDNTYAVLSKFQAMGATRVADPSQPVFALDHNVQDRSERNLSRYAAIEAFARKHGVDFYPAGRGIGHQVMCEEGYVQPFEMVVASDSHSNMYGALGALGTPVVRTDAAALWATTTTWWQVPPVARVWLEGRPGPGVTGKDVILALCGLFRGNEVLNHAVEFSGPGIAHLSVEERMTIANMSTEWGALAGVFGVDDVTSAWLTERADRLLARAGAAPPQRVLRSARIADDVASGRRRMSADDGAVYAKELSLDLSSLQPLVVGPNEVNRVWTVSELEAKRVPVHKAYIVSCVNSRVSDLAQAASVLRGRRVAEGVELYIAAASSEVEAESRRRGDWQALVQAGAIELPSGCGPCVGLGRGLLKDGEVAISATNRNFRGRMGSRQSQAYLASPAVVAESAARGFIAAPQPITERLGESSLGVCARVVIAGGEVSAPSAPPLSDEEGGGGGRVALREGFVPRVRGEAVLCVSDNIDTDGIYAGRHCYVDMDRQAQARVAMENYDPSFASLIRQGDVLVSGRNFGCGSSREQAATALLACGVSVVVVASANETYRRNALNNGLLLLECPALVDRIRARLTTTTPSVPPTLRTGLTVDIDFGRSVVSLDGEAFTFPPVGPVAQDIILAGGLEGWVQHKMAAAAQQHSEEERPLPNAAATSERPGSQAPRTTF